MFQIISTVDTAKYYHLMNLFIEHGKPFILVVTYAIKFFSYYHCLNKLVCLLLSFLD